MIKVDGSDERFECVAVDVFAVVANRVLDKEQSVDAETESGGVEGAASNDFASGLGEKTFTPIWEVSEEKVGNNAFDDSVAEVFKSFVVEVTTVRLGAHGDVGERLVVETWVRNTYAEDFFVDRRRLALKRKP